MARVSTLKLFLRETSRRSLTSVAFRDPNFKRRAPWPYTKLNYNWFWQLIDKTTLRWDENTKLIVVEGHGSPQRTELAKFIAKEFGMVHMPAPSTDEFMFRTADGKDFREFAEFLSPRLRPYAEPEFFPDPAGPYEGAADRYFYLDFATKFTNYVFALRHMFNTGEGVVLEGNPYSDYVLFNAAARAGYVAQSTKDLFEYTAQVKNSALLRPNLIVYLDADTKTFSNTLKSTYGGNTSLIRSPVWDNKGYLSEIMLNMKRDYLNKAKKHSYVLVYDWNTPGEYEIIIEDIERLNLNWYEKGDTIQKDWNLVEETYERVRKQVTNFMELSHLLNFYNITDSVDAENLFNSAEEVINMDNVLDCIDSERYISGWNPFNGDKPFFKILNTSENIRPRFYRKWEYADTHMANYVYPESKK